jgi:hypothetical protein
MILLLGKNILRLARLNLKAEFDGIFDPFFNLQVNNVQVKQFREALKKLATTISERHRSL